MDSARFKCSACGFEKLVPGDHSGRRAKCPKCQAESRIGPVLPAATNEPPNLIKFRCPICQQKIAAAPQHAGKQVRCVGCENPVMVPALAVAQSGVQSEPHSAAAEAASTVTDIADLGDMQDLLEMEKQTAAAERPRDELRLAPLPAAAAPAAAPQLYDRTMGPKRLADSGEADELESIVKRSAGWIFAVVGLSIVNSITTMYGSETVFVIGLGFTQIVDAFAAGFKEAAAEEGAAGAGGVITAICIAINLLVAAVYLTLGIFGRKGWRWAFITVLVLYSLDTLILLLATDIFGLLFHGLVLYHVVKGIQAAGHLRAIRA